MGAAVGAAALGGGMAAASGALSMYFQHLENKKAWHRYKKVLQKQMQWRARDATLAQAQSGIHRLAMLGISPASGPSMGGLGDLGAVSGQAADWYRAVEMGQPGAQTPEQKELGRAAIEQERQKTYNLWIDGQLKAFELESLLRGTPYVSQTGDLTLDELNRQGQASAGRKTSQGLVNMEKSNIKYSADVGIEAGTIPVEKWSVQNRFGHPYGIYRLVLTPDMSQSVEENLAFKAPYYTGKLGDALAGVIQKYGKRKGYELWMRYWIPRLPVSKVPGWHWEWSNMDQGFVMERNVRSIKKKIVVPNWAKHGRGYRSPKSWERLKRR